QLSFEQASAMLGLSRRRESVDFVWHCLGPAQSLQAWLASCQLLQDYRYDAASKRFMVFISHSDTFTALSERDLGEKLWALRQHTQALSASDYASLKADVVP